MNIKKICGGYMGLVIRTSIRIDSYLLMSEWFQYPTHIFRVPDAEEINS